MWHKLLRIILFVLVEYMLTVQQYHHQVNAQQSENEKMKKWKGKIKLYIWKHILHELIQYSNLNFKIDWIKDGGINWPEGAMAPPLNFFFNISIYICIKFSNFVLQNYIFSHKITFFPFLTISLILFKVTLQLQTYLQHFYKLLIHKFLLVHIWTYHLY